MKFALVFMAFLSGLIFSAACVQTVERVGPQGIQGPVDPYYRPKRVYAVDMAQAWDLTLKALNREGIPLEMVNKETGWIRTDYQNLSAWERNKCDLHFSPEPQQKTFIYVRCRYEGRREVTETFRDFSSSEPNQAMRAEEEIYQKIELYLLPYERSSKEQEEMLASSQPKPRPRALEKAVPKPEAAPPSPPTVAAEKQAQAPVAPPAVAAAKPEATAAPPPKITEETIQPGPTPQKAEPAGARGPIFLERKPQPETGKELSKTYLALLDNANLRGAPSTQSGILTVLKKGDRVEKFGESGLWMKVILPSGVDGWIHKSFLSEGYPNGNPDIVQSNPSSKPMKPDNPRKANMDPPAKVIWATKEITRMRAEPDPKSKVVLVLKKGRQVENLAESGAYTKVRLSWGDTGWVLTRYLEKVR